MTKRILLCDDEIHIVKAAEIKFLRAGFDVRCAADGQQAWEILETWQPDILVTDCQMPRLTGIELCRLCRSREATRSLPVIMLTAKGFELEHDELLRTCGITLVLPKPFSPRELLSTVEHILETGKVPQQQATCT